jgi:hypothetical protein
LTGAHSSLILAKLNTPHIAALCHLERLLDLAFFIKERLKFATYFFENSSRPFVDLVLAIEEEEPPFVPVYDESGEPQYL